MCARALTALRPKTKPNVLYVTNCNTGLVCWQRRFSEFCSSLPEKSLIEFMIIEKHSPEIGGWPGLLLAGGEAGVEDLGLVGCHPGERVIVTKEDAPV